MSAPFKPNDLYQQIIDLRARLDAIERVSQMGNTSVSVTASPAAQNYGKGFVILDASGKERVREGATDTDASPAAAQGLYGLSAKDTAGRIRVLLGQTSATPTYGLSTFDAAGVKRFTAGQIDGSTDGAAAYDASGNVIWDTTGLVKMISVQAAVNFTGAPFVQSMPALATTAFQSFSFTVPSGRTLGYLLLGTVNAQIQSAQPGGFFQNLFFQITSPSQTASNRGTVSNITNAGGFAAQSAVTLFQVLTLSGGSYSGNWYFINPWNGAVNVEFGDITLYAFQLGN